MENHYQLFLGISGTSRPDYYTLLGVQANEKDSATITDAASKRIQQLETQKTPENEAVVTQILSEIATARDCLLDEKARKQYEFQRLLDESVAEKTASENVTQTVNAPSTAPLPEATSNAMPPEGMSNFMPNPAPQMMPAPAFQAMQMGVTPGMMPGMPQPGMMPVQPQGMPGAVPGMDLNAVMPGMTPGVAPGFYPQQPGIAPAQPQGMPQPQIQPETIPQPESGLDFGGGFGSVSTSPRSATTSATRRKTNAGKSGSKTATRGKDNTPMILGGVVGVLLILVALGIYSGNTDTARAKKLYIEAQSAVNEYKFDRGRELMDRALALETTVEYENYRKSIDIKQKKYEKRLRHEAARQADDFDF